MEAEKKETEKKEKEALEREAAVLAARQQRQAEHQEPRFDKLHLSNLDHSILDLGSFQFACVARLPATLWGLFPLKILTQEEVQDLSNENGAVIILTES